MPDTQISDPLLRIVVEKELLSRARLEEIVEEHERTGNPYREILIDMDIVKEDQLLQLLAEHMGTRVVDLPSLNIPTEVVKAIPPSTARMYNVVPVEAGPNSVVLAISDLMDPELMDEIMFVLTRDVSFVLAREQDVKTLVERFFKDDNGAVDAMLTGLESEMEESGELPALTASEDLKAIEEAASSTPVIRFVNLVLYQAVESRATDIHFEPFEKEFKIRYRVDGALYEMAPPPQALALPVISRLKVMASLNIAERRLPQDGRIQITVAGRQIDLRVSSLPTQFGESVVLRVLDRSVVSLALENLGMSDDVYELMTTDIGKPNGIIIVTGPTGSGKTTTLYSALQRLNTVEVKMLTAEDPVEYDIEGIIQVPVVETIGVSFPRLLRHFLRQDPDVILIGEIRDLETAQIAIQASLTGHLVFSTLHTNDAPGAVARLIDLGVEPFLITSTLEAIVGQRLVRLVCEQCKVAYEPDEAVLQQLALSREDVGSRSFYYGEGCPKCHGVGYKGRKGLFEYMTINDPIRDLIYNRQPTVIIRNKAIELGMRTLREDGIRNILDGVTTVEEVLKYTS
ncbi:MAG: type II/IV secretion system protein [Kiritimatiellae bacterium]|nr:type II/IV secretion system protein [Kiritimatiellia bacterium]